jgi:hypothetical protein
MAVTVTNAAAPTALNAQSNNTNGKSPWTGSGYGAVANAVYQPIQGGVAVSKRLVLTKITLSSTYATGGFALVPSAYGLKSIDGLAIVCDPGSTSGGAAVPSLTTAGESPIVKLVTDNAGTELANATSVASHGFVVLLAGV